MVGKLVSKLENNMQTRGRKMMLFPLIDLFVARRATKRKMKRIL